MFDIKKLFYSSKKSGLIIFIRYLVNVIDYLALRVANRA
jgi:hypothetical protein